MNFTSIGFPQIVFIRMLSVSCAVLLQWIIPAFSGYTPRPRVSPLGIRVDPAFAGWLWRVQAWNTSDGRPRVYGGIQVGVRLRNLAVDPAFGGGLSHQPMADPKEGRPPRLRGVLTPSRFRPFSKGRPRACGVYRPDLSDQESQRRAIPADAGCTVPFCLRWLDTRGDPRACGVDVLVGKDGIGKSGEAPHGRGGLSDWCFSFDEPR